MNDFTVEAMQVIKFAGDEADRLNHNYTGTEHLLLALIKLDYGVAVSVLKKMGLDLETVRMEIEELIGKGTKTEMAGNNSYSPRVEKVLDLAEKAAIALKHSFAGNEHILLGLLLEGQGVAARVLKNLEIDIERTSKWIMRELNPDFTPEEEIEMSKKLEMLENDALDSSIMKHYRLRDFQDIGRLVFFLLVGSCSISSIRHKFKGNIHSIEESLAWLAENSESTVESLPLIASKFRSIVDLKEQKIREQDFETAAEAREEEKAFFERLCLPHPHFAPIDGWELSELESELQGILENRNNRLTSRWRQPC